MSIIFLEDRQLYTDFDYYQMQFNWNVTEVNDRLIIYHCYWTGVLNELHDLCLKSLMNTQSPPYEVWVWMPPEDLLLNQNFITMIQKAPNIQFKSYLPEVEASDTIYEGHEALLKDEEPRSIYEKHLASPRRRKPPAISDGFRILILGKYGGVYFDLDVLFLKDIRPLCNVEFFYQWSDQPFGNSAISHFFKNSPNIWALAERSIEIKICHPAILLRFNEISNLLEEVYVFPAFLFDPLWITQDRGMTVNKYCNKFTDFFTSTTPITLAEVFPGAYAYHWHNQWGAPIHKGTVIGDLYDEVRKEFMVKFQS